MPADREGSPIEFDGRYLTGSTDCEIIFGKVSLEMDPQQKKIYQSMPPEEKLNIALRLYDSARQLKTAALHCDHPDWTEEEVQEKVREIFLYART